jgi:hypothetical protein
MKRESTAPPAKQLCILAREFRRTRDEKARLVIADEYAEAVARLIQSNTWRKIPPLEDQLPDEWMPQAFFEYWSLTPPPRRAGEPG